jgi:Flp pilus assembly pilin Flp
MSQQGMDSLRFKERHPSKVGQALPEYALVLALITLFCIAAITGLGENIQQRLVSFAQSIASTKTSP